MASKLPTKITDRDLDSSGEYKFKQLVKLAYPHDYKDIEKIAGRDILESKVDL